MKRQAHIFTALAALALALCAGANALLLAGMDGYAFTGEALTGRRADTAGITVRQEAVLSRHAVWEACYYPRAAACASDGRWSLEETVLAEPFDPAINISHAGVARSSYGADTVGSMLNYGGLTAAVYRDFVSGADGGTYSERIMVGDYLDYIPILADGLSADIGEYSQYLGSADISDAFRVPVPEDYAVDATLSLDGERAELSFEPAGEAWFDTVSSSVYAADGSIYLSLAIRGTDGGLLDSSLLPGGSWGVYRIPCGEPDANGSVSADLRAAELIYAVGGEAESMELELSADGSRLLLLTVEDGTLMLNVLTTDGGLLQRLELLTEAEYHSGLTESDLTGAAERAESYPGSAYHVLRLDGTAIVLTEDGGVYSRAMTACIAGLPVPERHADGWYTAAVQGLVFDGERLALLEDGSLTGDDGRNRPGFQRLSVFDASGELIYCEWIETPLNDGQFNYDLPVEVRFSLEVSR